MKKAPIYYKPGTWEPLNGQLPDGAHAGELDQFACYLATQRLSVPVDIGRAMTSISYFSIEYSTLLHVPQFCEHIALYIKANGSGTITVDTSDDAYSAKVEVNTKIDTAATPEYGNATWHQLVMPMDSVTVDTESRALDVDDLDHEHVVTLTYTCPVNVYVWEVVPFFLPRRFDTTLPGGVATYYADSVPVGYWSMYDWDGSTVSDMSSAGNGLDGTKASSTAGQPYWDTSTSVLGGASLRFDQADLDAVIVPDDDVLDFSTDDPFTISCWIKRSTDYSGNVAGLVTKSAASSGVDSPYEGYAVWFNDFEQRRPSFLLYRQVSGVEQLRVQASALAFADSDTDWHHICVTYNGNSDLDGVTMYVDGSSVTIGLASPDTLSAGTDITTATDLCFGGFINSATTNSRILPYAGNMDEIAIWSKELSADEVTAVYNSGAGVNLSNGIPST
jgi:hypothetical protein